MAYNTDIFLRLCNIFDAYEKVTSEVGLNNISIDDLRMREVVDRYVIAHDIHNYENDNSSLDETRQAAFLAHEIVKIKPLSCKFSKKTPPVAASLRPILNEDFAFFTTLMWIDCDNAIDHISNRTRDMVLDAFSHRQMCKYTLSAFLNYIRETSE